MLHTKQEEIVKEQIQLCDKYNAVYVAAPHNFKIVISLNVKSGLEPINGLRHPIEGDTTGWYIWVGEYFSEEPNFFSPLHIEHLNEWNPEILKYLGLPPGYRFLFAKNYEDVWMDNSLLTV